MTRLRIDLPCRRISFARSAAEVLGDGLMRLTREAMREVFKIFLGLGWGDRRNGRAAARGRPRRVRSASIRNAYGCGPLQRCGPNGDEPDEPQALEVLREDRRH